MARKKRTKKKKPAKKPIQQPVKTPKFTDEELEVLICKALHWQMNREYTDDELQAMVANLDEDDPQIRELMISIGSTEDLMARLHKRLQEEEREELKRVRGENRLLQVRNDEMAIRLGALQEKIDSLESALAEAEPKQIAPPPEPEQPAPPPVPKSCEHQWQHWGEAWLVPNKGAVQPQIRCYHISKCSLCDFREETPNHVIQLGSPNLTFSKADCDQFRKRLGVDWFDKPKRIAKQDDYAAMVKELTEKYKGKKKHRK